METYNITYELNGETLSELVDVSSDSELGAWIMSRFELNGHETFFILSIERAYRS